MKIFFPRLQESDNFQIRATMQSGSLDFAPTQQSSSLAPSSLLAAKKTQFKQGPSFGSDTMSLQPAYSSQKSVDVKSVVRLGRRFESGRDHDKSKAYFAGQHVRAEQRRRAIARDRKGRRFAQVTLMRNYRYYYITWNSIENISETIIFRCYHWHQKALKVLFSGWPDRPQ